MTPPQVLKFDQDQVSFRKIGNGSRKILFFHGFPGSSAQAEVFLAQAAAFDLEVICIDRPGYNQSIASGENQFQRANHLIQNLLNHFGWTVCEVMSISGGTPFLFSFVQHGSHEISKVCIVSGLGPIATAKFRKILKPKMKWTLWALPFIPEALITQIMPKPKKKISASQYNFIRYFMPASPADQKAIQNLLAQTVLSTAIQEAFVQKGIGPKQDAKMYLTPWSLHLGSYQGPIHIWHGLEDRILPAQMAEQMQSSIPRSELHLIPGEGHYSLAINFIQNILA